MEHLLACSFSKYLCRNKIIEDEYYDIYVYGAELLLSFIVTTGIILLIGLLTGSIPMTLCHVTVFILLRRFTGGYHAKTYLKCKIITIAVYLLVLVSATFVDVHWYLYPALLCIGNITIRFLAPVENPNKPLTDPEKIKFRRLSHIFFSLLTIAGMGLSFFCQPLGNTVFYSLLSVIVLMLITIFMKGDLHDEKDHGEEVC